MEPFALAVDVAERDADLVTVDALARLQLAVRRLGGEIRLRGASADLVDLVALLGLREALPTEGEAGGRTGGRASPSPGRT